LGMDLAVTVVTRLALDLVVLGVLVLPPARTDPVGDFPWDASELTSLAWVLMVIVVNDVAWCGLGA
jgi:hypothetical protein